MSQLQLNFTLRTTANCKTAHLVGSWDGYKALLPLSKDSSKSGGWKGTFRFPATVLKQGQRYWYYYIIDGFHVSHDPAREYVVEPTTGRKLNILDIPAGTTTTTTTQSTTATSRESRQSRRQSAVPKGRPLSVSEIKSPRPCKPLETQRIRQEQFRRADMESLTSKLSAAHLHDHDSDSDYSDADSDVPSLVSRSSGASTPSSVSSASSCCTCERYGITRAGSRVRLDCGGSRCGSDAGSAYCSSDESEGEYRKGSTRRNGVIMRHSPVRLR